MVGDELIVRLGRATSDAAQFGGKAAGLGRLIDLGHCVPPGYAVAVAALPMAIAEWGLSETFRTLEDSMRNGSPDLAAAERIHDSLLKRAVPSDLIAMVERAAAELGGARLIVRSSAASEDSAAHSYAGIFESTPVAQDQIGAGISTVWASAFAPRAIAYTAHAGLGHVPRMGVVVQRFIEAERSGVMFTSFPGPKGSNDILVEHVAGTAEKLVRGEVTPSRSWLRSDPEDKGDLGATQAATLARLAVVLEDQFGGPQDVEWCVLDAELHVVQTRPITASVSAAVGAAELDEADAELVILRGTPASPGVASGGVHLAFNVDQALAVESGDVLVTPMTNPDMVVAMRKSAAIVTDVGGMICHAAIVSRELQLPCVVGTGGATELLAAGATVTVDGGLGAVFEGEVERRAVATRRATAADLWAQFPSDAVKNVIPLVSTVELLTDVPPGHRTFAYLIDGDIRCSGRGLWKTYGSTQDLHAAIAEALGRVVAAAPQADCIHVVSHGAVSVEALIAGVDQAGDDRLVAAGEIVVAPEMPPTPPNGPTAVPLGACVARGETHRRSLVSVEQSVARSLDPSQGPGPTPQVRPAPMPAWVWRRRWWDRLVEYGRYHRDHPDASHDPVPWIEIRPEVLTSPMLKSLVQPGFEMVPRVLGLAGTMPMHTKWAKCRFHVRADAFAEMWRQLVAATWDQEFMEELLRAVRQSYDQLAEIVRLFPETDAEARLLDNQQLVALITAWWPRWVEFFALCLFIQAQGEAILFPVIAETVEANLADLGDRADGVAWPSLPDLVAPTTPVLSGEYMASVGQVRAELDAAGLVDAEAAILAVERGDPPELAAAVAGHLQRWRWMRDHDLLFEPWDTVERVVETALGTGPHPPVPYEANRRQNRIALAFHADLAEAAGRGSTLRHGVRFLQDLNVERENHHVLWLEYSYPLRRVVLEAERRLIDVGSRIEPGMIFFLQAPELLDALEALPAALPNDLCELARARRTAYRHESQLERVDPNTLYREDDYY